MRRLVRHLLGFLLRVFFRRIEIDGLSRVPASGPVLFCPNHPNALVDPVLLLATAPRPVSFLAKAPLFRMPVIGWFARTLESIPVYRRQDGRGDTSRNAEMFAAARRVLEGDGAIAIFPEGTSHSDPGLRPLRTGAARIALGAGTREPVRIVPVALIYSAKTTFRSAALICFGEPIPIAPLASLPEGEPPAEPVDALTDQLAEGMRAILVQADRQEALAVAAAVERLFLPDEDQPAERPGLAESAALRRRLLAAYPEVERRAPARLAALRARLERHESRLRGAGMDPALLVARPFTLGAVLVYTATESLHFAIAAPLALPGLLIHWPTYRLVGSLAARYSGGSEDVLATAKALGALLLLPLTWLAVGLGIGAWLGWPLGLVAAVVAPWSGWVALRFVERFDQVAGATRALALWLGGREKFLRLLVERRRLREEVVELARELGIGSVTGTGG